MMLNIADPKDLAFLRSFALDQSYDAPIDQAIEHAARVSGSKAGMQILENIRTGFRLHEAFLRLSPKRPDAWSDLVDLASLISLVSMYHDPEHDPISYRVAAYVFSYVGNARVDGLKAVLEELKDERADRDRTLLLASVRNGVETGEKLRKSGQLAS